VKKIKLFKRWTASSYYPETRVQQVKYSVRTMMKFKLSQTSKVEVDILALEIALESNI
jgi:hypothetical protein